jgi:WD40 repeat protein
MIKRLNTNINDSISCLDFYKKNFIVAGCQDGSLKVWDRRMYKLVIDEQGHRTKYDEGILCLKTTESGIFTGGADGVINFYTI